MTDVDGPGFGSEGGTGMTLKCMKAAADTVRRLLHDRRGSTAVFVAAGMVALTGAVGLATDAARGYLVKAKRPCMSLMDIQHVEAACGKVYSFPSNHAINTAAAAAFLQVLYPRSGWVSWPLVGLIGLSRVYIGAHYLTDVLGGWVIGGLFGAGAAWLLMRYSRVRSSMASPAA